jgi:ABC-type sugar transport system ATPase subunit
MAPPMIGDTPGGPRKEREASYETTELTRAFPGVLAVDRASISIRRGEIHGIIGKNGAGKTVLMSVLAGIYPATSGQLEIGGHSVDLTRHTPARAKDLAIALIPQEPLFAPDLSVMDNLFMGRVTARGGFVDVSRGRQILAEVCEKLSLKIDPKQRMNTLGIEDQQMLALGRALYIDHARVLLLDEITASLPRDRKRVLDQTLQRAIAERPEISVTLITHHIDEVIEFCDRVTVMRDGRCVATLEVPQTSKAILASWITGDERAEVTIAARELGAGVANVQAPVAIPVAAARVPTPKALAESGPIALSVSTLGVGTLLADLSFDLRRGEVLGIAGLDGSGKDEVFSILSGLLRSDRGSIRVSGQPVTFKSPVDARKAGIAYLPKKRDQYAVLTGRPVDENALAMIYPSLTWMGLINNTRARDLVEDGIKTLRVKTPSHHTVIDALSGGNRQKTMIMRILMSDPKVYLLNEPTRGVDLATKPDLLLAIRSRLAGRGCVVVTSESEEELVEICDRVLVLYRGVVFGDLALGTPEFNASNLYRLIQGVQ